MAAVGARDIELVTLLLDRGARVNHRSGWKEDKATALDVAHEVGAADIAQLLEARGAQQFVLGDKSK